MVDRPEDISKIDATRPIGDGEEPQQEPSRSFKSVMNEQNEQQVQGSKSNQPSPFDLPQDGKFQLPAPTQESVVHQMNSTSSMLGDIQNQLNTKNLQLKPSQKYLLRNKLTESNSLIRSAATKVGVDPGPLPQGVSQQSPIAKFLALVTDGQNQLQSATNSIKHLQTQGGHINSGELLMVQVKLAKAQQELEYSSVLLSKAVDDLKTLFNIQI
ncbi:MAG: hypothetical protein KBC64_06935 [Simkaniaceae bacterium]|nr:hypothetical protein [Simkaniaceae bacterium]